MSSGSTSRWSRAFPILYRVLRRLEPILRTVQSGSGIGNVLDVRIPDRRTGRTRSVLLGILRTPDGLYLGHPNGRARWTRDAEAAGNVELRWPGGSSIEARLVLLPEGPERDAAIAATGQHPFPGNLIYRLARRHIAKVGVYFRVEAVTDSASRDGDNA